MDSELFFRVLIPMLSGIFSLMIFIFWWRIPNREFYISLAAGFFICCVTHIVTFFVLPGEHSMTHVLITIIGFTLALFVFASGMNKRLELSKSVLPILFVGGLGLSVTIAADVGTDIINLRLILLNATLGTMLCVGAWIFREVRHRSSSDMFLFIVVGGIGLTLIITPQLTLAVDGPLTAANYPQSIHKYVFGLVTAVSILVFSFALGTACIADLLRDVKRASGLDHLTGLNARAGFEDEVKNLFDGLCPKRDVSLLVMDIDNFKFVNDKYGHPVGDAVIRAFGSVIDSSIRDTDLPGRVGGEEFCIVLPDTDAQEAVNQAQRLRSRFAETVIDGLPDKHEVTVSIGVAQRRNNEEYHRQYSRADHALYLAKEKGRDRVIIDTFDAQSIKELDTFQAASCVKVQERPLANVA